VLGEILKPRSAVMATYFFFKQPLPTTKRVNLSSEHGQNTGWKEVSEE
jgi:hypothetical protein